VFFKAAELQVPSSRNLSSFQKKFFTQKLFPQGPVRIVQKNIFEPTLIRSNPNKWAGGHTIFLRRCDISGDGKTARRPFVGCLTFIGSKIMKNGYIWEDAIFSNDVIMRVRERCQISDDGREAKILILGCINENNSVVGNGEITEMSRFRGFCIISNNSQNARFKVTNCRADNGTLVGNGDLLVSINGPFVRRCQIFENGSATSKNYIGCLDDNGTVVGNNGTFRFGLYKATCIIKVNAESSFAYGKLINYNPTTTIRYKIIACTVDKEIWVGDQEIMLYGGIFAYKCHIFSNGTGRIDLHSCKTDNNNNTWIKYDEVYTARDGKTQIRCFGSGTIIVKCLGADDKWLDKVDEMEDSSGFFKYSCDVSRGLQDIKYTQCKTDQGNWVKNETIWTHHSGKFQRQCLITEKRTTIQLLYSSWIEIRAIACRGKSSEGHQFWAKNQTKWESENFRIMCMLESKSKNVTTLHYLGCKTENGSIVPNDTEWLDKSGLFKLRCHLEEFHELCHIDYQCETARIDHIWCRTDDGSWVKDNVYWAVEEDGGRFVKQCQLKNNIRCRDGEGFCSEGYISYKGCLTAKGDLLLNGHTWTDGNMAYKCVIESDKNGSSRAEAVVQSRFLISFPIFRYTLLIQVLNF